MKIGLRGGRLRRVAVVLLLGALEVACNENYRPIVEPVLPPQPNPSAFHYVISVTANGSLDPGSASRIDVSGDTYAGVFKTGVGPVHAALNPTGTKLYLANFLEDTVSVNNVSTPTVVGTISLPAGAGPVFVHSADPTNMYLANYGNGTVAAINATSDVVIGSLAVGNQPVAMAELPNFQKLYVANQGSGTVTSINVVGFSVGKTIPVGSAPVWALARPDSAKIYVLDNSGTIYEIDTLSDTVTGTSSSAGAGSNFMAFDPVVQRLYVTNPANGMVAILSTATDPNPPALLKVIDLSQGPNAPCPAGCSPVAVTGIGDGSRAYVASYQLATCTDFLLNPFPCVNTQVEVINAGSNTISKVVPTSAGVPVDLTNATDCGPQTGPPAAVPWTPGNARFRAFVAASGGGSTTNFKVYVSQCDAGSVAVIDTFADNLASPPHPADTYSVSLTAPLSSFPPLQASVSGATIASGATTYTYTPANLGLQAGMQVFITGMADAGNNGYFVITAVDKLAGALTVANPAGVPASGQNGSGTVLPPQNPIYLVAGP